MNIRGKSISFSAYKKKTTDSKEKNLIEDIASLEKQNIHNTDSLETKKTELENIRKIKMQGQFIRSRYQNVMWMTLVWQWSNLLELIIWCMN